MLNMENYDFEIEKIAKAVKKEKARKILLQFPDGLKPKSLEILKKLEGKTGKEFIIWQGSCFGACDLPPTAELEKLGVDLIIQFGHAPWNYKNNKSKRQDIKTIKI